jgi:hypothetical protein
MNSIEAIKIGKTINLSINGKLENKTFKTSEEANEFYKKILAVRPSPTDADLKMISMYLNDTTRIVGTVPGFEVDIIDNQVYLAGFNTPIPKAIAEVAQDYHENKFPYDTIVNFWKLLMINPDKRVHKTLFDFIAKFNMTLSTHGYFLAYKAVRAKKPEIAETERPKFDLDYVNFIENSYKTVKDGWKCSPKKYVVYTTEKPNDYHFTKETTFQKWADPQKKSLGTLADLFEQYRHSEDQETAPMVGTIPVYTDKYSGKMRIVLGEPVVMERKDCDGDPSIECSYGLHVGSTQYVEAFSDSYDVILACLVNPAHVIAVPDYDTSKMRVCQYFPFAVMDRTDNKIVAINQSYFESGYIEYEKEELAKMAEKIKKSQAPIDLSKGCLSEDRPLSELQKIIESRLIDLQ